MANIFVDLPVPIANGAGASVAVDGMGEPKTVTYVGDLFASVQVQVSDDGVTFRTAYTFAATAQAGSNQTLKKSIQVAARFMRAFVSNFRSGTSANMDVGANDIGTAIASPVAPAGNGAGAGLSVAALGTFNTVYVSGVYSGNVVLEISDDGIDWVPCLSFNNQGGYKSKEFVAQFVRVLRDGVNASAPGLPTVSVVAVNDPTAGGGVATGAAPNCLIFRPGSGLAGPVIFDTWAGLIAQLAVLRAASNAGGCYTIQFDDTIVSPAVVPVGAYDMTDVRWQGFRPDQVAPFVRIVEGVTFTKLRHFDHLDVEFTGATPPITDFVGAGDSVTLENRTIIFATAAGPMFRQTAAGTVLLRMLHDGQLSFGSGGAPWDVAFAATLDVHAFDDAVLPADTVSGIAGASLVLRRLGPSALINFTQTAFAGAISRVNQTEARVNIRDVAANGIATVNELQRVDTSGGNVVRTLPPSGLATQGQIIVLKKVTADAFTVTAAPSGGDAINGGTVLSALDDARVYRDTGTGAWDEVSNSISAASGTAILQWGETSIAASADTRYLSFGFTSRTAPTTPDASWRAPRAGVLRNFRVRHNSAAGNGASVVYDFEINTVAQGLGLSLASGAIGDASDLVTTIAVAAGDLIDAIAVKAASIGSGGQDVSLVCEFE